MSAEDTIRILLGGADAIDARRAARRAWAMATAARWRDAMDAMNDRCDDAVDKLDEEAFERLCDEEAAKVDAIRAQLDDVIERDKWPRELYFGCI